MNFSFMNFYFDELCHLTFMHVHEQFMFFWWMFMNNFHERFMIIMNNSSNFRRGRGGINPIIELTLTQGLMFEQAVPDMLWD